jgi:tetratricopeptide (TPR) repeat protein
MRIKTSHLFTILIAAFISTASAKIVETETNDGFFRTKLYAQKELLKVNKLGNKITLKTLNNEVYEELLKDLKAINNKKFISKINNVEPREGNNLFIVELVLKPGVEVFSFYKNRDKAYFVDFWKEEKPLKRKMSAIKAPAKKKAVAKPIVVKRKSAPKKVVRVKVVKKAPKKVSKYRDFRYGASFIWDYKALNPKISRSIRLNRKTPEYFFPIKDREFEKSEKEAHVQLTVNLYRKKKWGLMYKSIKLYEKKYGDDKNHTINEYMKANALLRESRDRDDLKPTETAVAMFSNIAEKSTEYEMRKGIFKYLIQYYVEKGDNIRSMKYAKRFFADAKENFDYEELEYAAELILFSLARINQIEKIQEIMRDKTLLKVISKQKMIAYEMFTLLKLGNEEQVIKEFERFTKANKGSVLPSIYYNAAEAYFRQSQYKKAIKVFDTFLSKYSYHTNSSHARLRIALASDILEKKPEVVLELYKNTINRSQDKNVSLEARIRYVAFRTIRNRKTNAADQETRIFLDKGEKDKVGKDLERVLWLTRLRTFIVDKEYENALTFLTALPLASMKPSYKKVFEGDGAEVVYGIIKKNYELGNYGKAIRAWEIYKNVYFEKVAADTEIQFVVAKSYINLGLWDGFQRTYSRMLDKEKEKVRSFPIWVTRLSKSNRNVIGKELQVLRNIKLKNWGSVDKIVSEIEKSYPAYPKKNFFRALAHYNQKQYAKAESEYEKFYSSNKNFQSIDGKDLVDSVKNYVESIYEQAKYNKFLEVSEGLLKDASKFAVEKPVFNAMAERIKYLRLEVLFSKQNPNALTDAEKFVKNFEKSTYINRIKFLLGRENLRTNNLKKGEEILNGLINGNDVADYIKEMARAELTLLNLKKRTL